MKTNNGIDYESLNKGVRKAISVTGLADTHIRKAFQNAPTNKEPYASYRVSNVYQKARDGVFYRNKTDIDLNERKIGFRYVEVEINFFGEGALDMASQVIHAMQSSELTEYFYKLNIGYIDCQDVRDTTDLEMGAWEERGTITPTFYLPSVYDAEVREIRTAEIDCEAISGNKKYEVKIYIKNKNQQQEA